MNSEIILKLAPMLVIIAIAGIVLHLLRRGMIAVDKHQWLPPTMQVLLRGFLRWSIFIAVGLIFLEVVGLPIRSLWTGLLSVMLLVAVAFVAAWSILSNILSAMLLLTFSRARIGDVVELKDTKQDEVGMRGRIVDINLFFVTLQELTVDTSVSDEPAMVQIPCHLFFYRVTRCWAGVKTQPLIDAFQDETTLTQETAAPEKRKPE